MAEVEADMAEVVQSITVTNCEYSEATLASTKLAPQKRKQMQKRSAAWKEMVILDGSSFTDKKQRAQCIHCKTATFFASSHYGTTNMNDHLKICPQYREYLKKNGKQATFSQAVYRELVARAIIQHGYAFSWVEHAANRKIHAYLRNEVKTITRNTAKADCLNLHKKLMVELKRTLQDLPGRICLTADMWTSCQTEGYLCLTAHYVDFDWMLKSRVLNFANIESPHTGHAMYSAVLSFLRDWGIEKKVFSITLDNASSNDKMQDYLRETLASENMLVCKGQYFHVRCAAHVLNLIVQDGLTMIKPIIKKIRLSVKHVKWSEVRKQNFKACVLLAGIKETKALWLDVPTRWNSTYMMLDRAILYRRAFKELKSKDHSYLHFPEPEEWEKVERIRDILEPFCDITELFSGRDYPTANLYFENVWRISMLLKDMVMSEDDDIRAMGVIMVEKFDKYWFSEDENYNILFAFAVILDPRYKKQFLKFCYQSYFEDEWKSMTEVTDVIIKLQNLLREYVPEVTNQSNSNNTESSSSKSMSRKRKHDLAQFDQEESMENNSLKTKLDLYLEDARLDRNSKLDILSFWRENEGRYGELSVLARDILTVPLTTVASESTFSIGGRVLNKWRSSYLPENVEALITSRSWLHGYEVADEEAEFLGTDVEWNKTR